MAMNQPLDILLKTREEWVRDLIRHRIKPTRSMGQNFLVEPEVVRQIADIAGVDAGSRVVEIGPGFGILSRELLSRGAQLHAVELDDELALILKRELGNIPAFSLERRDARFVDTSAFFGGASYQVVANLPYSVATVIIRHFLGAEHAPVHLTVMVQLEVAERMTAKPGEMSLLGIASQLYAESAIALVVPPNVFRPAPKVESAVVTMKPREDIGLLPDEETQLFNLATMAFQRKRKTLANGLSQGLDRAKSEIGEMLSAVGIDPMRRPQTLDVEEWKLLARTLTR